MFFTFSYQKPIRCCSYFQNNLLLIATDNNIVVFNLAQGRQISKPFQFQQQIQPISLSIISPNHFIVQNKLKSLEYFKIIWTQNQSQFKIVLQKSVPINFVSAFTKIQLQQKMYLKNLANERLQLVKIQEQRFNKNFFCLVEIDSIKFIAKVKSQTGQIVQRYQYDEDQNISITFIVYFQIQGTASPDKFILIAEEGCVLNCYQLPNSASNQKQYFLQRKHTLKLINQQQIKIVLYIELMDNGRALVCMRENNIVIIDIVKMGVITTIQNSYLARKCTFLGNSSKFIIVLSKKNIYAMPASLALQSIQINAAKQFKKVESVQTSLINQIYKNKTQESIQIYGVCEDGKIFYFDIQY